jgi:hypothetical protein
MAELKSRLCLSGARVTCPYLFDQVASPNPDQMTCAHAQFQPRTLQLDAIMQDPLEVVIKYAQLCSNGRYEVTAVPWRGTSTRQPPIERTRSLFDLADKG